MSGDPTRRGLRQRLSAKDTFFLGCVILSLTALAIAFSSYQAHDAYSAYCQASAHAGEQGCKAIKPVWEPVFSDPVMFFTFATALFTGGLVLIGSAQAGLFWWQLDLIGKGLADTKDAAEASKEQARLARESLIASNRPWLDGEMTLGNQPLSFVNGGLSTSVGFKLKNIGNSPALKVSLKAWLIGAGRPYKLGIADRHQLLCMEAKLDQPTFEFMLFPNQTFPDAIGLESFTIQASMSADDLARSIMPQAFGNVVAVFLGGCVNYSFGTDPDGIHQTAFLVELRKVTPPFLIYESFGNIPCTDLALLGMAPSHGKTAD